MADASYNTDFYYSQLRNRLIPTYYWDKDGDGNFEQYVRSLAEMLSIVKNMHDELFSRMDMRLMHADDIEDMLKNFGFKFNKNMLNAQRFKEQELRILCKTIGIEINENIFDTTVQRTREVYLDYIAVLNALKVKDQIIDAMIFKKIYLTNEDTVDIAWLCGVSFDRNIMTAPSGQRDKLTYCDIMAMITGKPAFTDSDIAKYFEPAFLPVLNKAKGTRTADEEMYLITKVLELVLKIIERRIRHTMVYGYFDLKAGVYRPGEYVYGSEEQVVLPLGAVSEKEDLLILTKLFGSEYIENIIERRRLKNEEVDILIKLVTMHYQKNLVIYDASTEDYNMLGVIVGGLSNSSNIAEDFLEDYMEKMGGMIASFTLAENDSKRNFAGFLAKKNTSKGTAYGLRALIYAYGFRNKIFELFQYTPVYGHNGLKYGYIPESSEDCIRYGVEKQIIGDDDEDLIQYVNDADANAGMLAAIDQWTKMPKELKDVISATLQEFLPIYARMNIITFKDLYIY